MENTILVIWSVLFLILAKFIFAYIKKTIKLKKLLIEWVFDFLGLFMIYIYPFIFDLLLLENWSWWDNFILKWSLLFRVILALLLLLWIPWILSYGKKFILNKFSFSTGSYFLIGNMVYFLFLIPLVLTIVNWILNKF